MSNDRITDKQTAELLKHYKQTGDQKVLEILILSKMRLVHYIIKKYLNTGMPYEDLKSLAVLGLIKAINKFDIQKPIEAFTKYISITIDNQILEEIRKEKKHRRVISFETPISQSKDGDDLTIEDIIGSDEDALFNEVVSEIKSEIVRNALRCLTYQEQQLILLRFGLNDSYKKTQEEAAKMLNCSQSQIKRLEKKALIKMRHPRNVRQLKDFYDEN